MCAASSSNQADIILAAGGKEQLSAIQMIEVSLFLLYKFVCDTRWCFMNIKLDHYMLTHYPSS